MSDYKIMGDCFSLFVFFVGRLFFHKTVLQNGGKIPLLAAKHLSLTFLTAKSVPASAGCGRVTLCKDARIHDRNRKRQCEDDNREHDGERSWNCPDHRQHEHQKRAEHDGNPAPKAHKSL